MSDLPYTLSFPSMGCMVVHAGLVPGVPLESQDAEAMSSMRNVVEVGAGGGYEARSYTTEGMRSVYTTPLACVGCIALPTS